MDYLSRFSFVLFMCSAALEQQPVVSLPTTRERTEASRRETMHLPPPYLNLPQSVDSRLPLVDQQYFSPLAGTGMEPLNQSVRDILIPTVSPSTRLTTVSGLPVNVVCEPEKIRVQVPKSIVGDGDLSSRVKVGTCFANVSTADHLIFEFDYQSCGIEQTVRKPSAVNGGTSF